MSHGQLLKHGTLLPGMCLVTVVPDDDDNEDEDVPTEAETASGSGSNTYGSLHLLQFILDSIIHSLITQFEIGNKQKLSTISFLFSGVV